MKFKFAKTLCVGAALVMLSAPAMAQQGPYNGGGQGGSYNGGPGNMQHDNGGPGNMQHMGQPQPGMMGGGNGYNHPGNPGMQGQMHGEGYAQHGNAYGHDWRRGQHFNGHREVVGDWHQYGLHRPPHGYEWVRDGNQFVLIAIASGIISSIVLNSMYH